MLVYPVYWWSMPGLLKGWIDRVFTNGWAYDEGPDAKPDQLQVLVVELFYAVSGDHWCAGLTLKLSRIAARSWQHGKLFLPC